MYELATAYVELQNRLFRHYLSGDYEAALQVVEKGGRDLDTLWTRVAWWRACLLCLTGRPDEALAVLEAAIAAGAWWSETMFRRELDLDPIRDLPQFEALVEESESRKHALAAALPGLVVVAAKPENPVALVLHGRAEMIEITLGTWGPALTSAGWTAVFPESSQHDSVDGPVWDDAERSAEEVFRHLADLESIIGDTPVVLAGFSQGGRRALQLTLDTTGVRGAILLCPTILRKADIAEILLGGDLEPTRLAIITGDRDPAIDGQRIVAEELASRGHHVHLDVVAGTGHQAPDDFDRRLLEAMAFVDS